MKILLSLLILFFLLCSLHKTVNAAQPQAIRQDSSAIKTRIFDQEVLSLYKAQKDFQYGSSYQSAESVWDRFWRWFWNYFGNIVADAASGNSMMYISIAVLTGLVIFIVIKLAGVGILQIFTGISKPVEIPYSESLENIHEINFEPEIEKAIQNLDYRLAVRMLYLKCLKKLSDSGMISWQIDKTNSAYITELSNPDRKQRFALLTRRFEYIWYGEFDIDRSVFGKIHEDFLEFNKGL